MHTGALLVLIGTILCAASAAVHLAGPRRRENGTTATDYAPLMLSVGAALIGIGVLVGGTAL